MSRLGIKKSVRVIMRKQSGFTLIELMIVVAIIGVLTAVAIISYENFTAKADRNINCAHALPQMASDQQKYFNLNRVYADTFAKLNTVTRVGVTWSSSAETTSHSYLIELGNSGRTFLLTCALDGGGLDASDCGGLTYDNFGRKGGVGATGTPARFSGGSNKLVEICWR